MLLWSRVRLLSLVFNLLNMIFETIRNYIGGGTASIGTALQDFVSSFYINTPGFGSSFRGGAAFSAVLAPIIVIIRMLGAIVLALAVVYFLWGVLQYVISDDTKKREEAIETITYGVIILFVMVSMWSLVFLIGRTFDLGRNEVPRTQAVPINRLTR